MPTQWAVPMPPIPSQLVNESTIEAIVGNQMKSADEQHRHADHDRERDPVARREPDGARLPARAVPHLSGATSIAIASSSAYGS